jgi:putative Holliday junction resolvase
MNILGLDIGDKKIGIAISESGIIASELTTIANDEQSIPFLIDLCNTKNVEKIVVGLPRLRSGEESLQAKKIKGFMTEFLEKNPMPLVYEDEILTTKEAERILISQGMGFEQINARVDQLSARLILEQYLSHQ